MKPWFRVYYDILTDSKLLSLSLDNQGIFFKYLAVSSQENPPGTLPYPPVLARQVGLRVDKVRSSLKAMSEVGLIAEIPGTQRFRFNGWNKRQFESDDSTARSQRHRGASEASDATLQPPPACNVPRVRATDTDSDTETEEREIPPSPPLGVIAPETEAKPLLASTPEETARVAALASAVLSNLTAGDVWVTRCIGFTRTYPAAWVEMLVPGIASKLQERHGGFTPESWAKSILEKWTKAGEPFGPLARASPGSLASEGPEKAPGNPVVRSVTRPMTEHQRKIARFAEVAWRAPDEEASDDGDGKSLGDEADGEARGPARAGRRAHA